MFGKCYLIFRNGTRIDNCKKNIGKNKYSFSKIRLKLLPAIFQPPEDTIAESNTDS